MVFDSLEQPPCPWGVSCKKFCGGKLQGTVLLGSLVYDIRIENLIRNAKEKQKSRRTRM